MEETLNTTSEQVSESLDLSTIKSFKAVNADGTEVEVSTDELVNAITEQVAMNFQAAANSIMPMAETSTQAANDVYENALPVQTSFTHFRTMNSGTSGMATNQKVAEVLGGLLGINDTWFRYRGIRTITDFNDAMTGSYDMEEFKNIDNAPIGLQGGHGELICFSNSSWRVQIFKPLVNEEFGLRIYDSGGDGWSSWYKFTGVKI